MAALVFGLTAIAFELAGKNASANAVRIVARKVQATTDGVPENVRESMTQQSHAALDRGKTLELISLCVAAVSGFCLVVSIARQERGWHSLAGTALIVYVLLWLIQV